MVVRQGTKAEGTKAQRGIKTYRDLQVWQKAIQLVTALYRKTKCFPADELYGLTSQIRRSSVSIPANLAEGYGRNSTQDYVRFLRIAAGSLYELQTLLDIACNLEYISVNDFNVLYESSREIERMLSTLIKKVAP